MFVAPPICTQLPPFGSQRSHRYEILIGCGPFADIIVLVLRIRPAGGRFGTIFATRLSDQLARFPHSVVARLGSGIHLSPAAARQLPPAVHTDFLHAFANSLHGVFLWGMAIASLPFALSWLLKEVPLRTTVRRSAELSAEQATAGGATPDAIVEAR